MSFRQRTAQHVASRSFEERYARLVLAMSFEEAKQILGLPAYGMPSEADISKAWRTLAFKFHPDRGGDLDIMTKVNVAKDVLLGNQRPSFDPSWSKSPSPPPPPREPEPVAYTKGGQTFQQAWADNAPPANTEWKFCSVPSWASGKPTMGASGYKATEPEFSVYVFYGHTASKHIFLAIRHNGESYALKDEEGNVYKVLEDWQVSWMGAHIDQPLVKIAQKYLKNVATGWADNIKVKAPIKYYPFTDKPTEQAIKKVRYAGGYNLKDILVMQDLVSEDAPEVKGRKAVVEIIPIQSKAKVEALRAKGKRSWYKNEVTDFHVRINGKEVVLADATVTNIDRSFIPGTIGYDYDYGKVYNLSRARGGRVFKMNAAEALRMLLDCLTSEPTWFVMALTKAAEEIEHEIRTASTTTLREAAEQEGISMLEAYRRMLEWA
jgi:hypothetical protein